MAAAIMLCSFLMVLVDASSVIGKSTQALACCFEQCIMLWIALSVLVAKAALLQVQRN